MSINKEQVLHIAKLAQLELTEIEKSEYTTQLTNILGFVDKLNELDLTNVEPTCYPFSSKNIMREDEVGVSLSNEKAVALSEGNQNGYFKVPPVFDGGES